MVNRILIVCVGNLCRSPMAEVILRHRLSADVVVESAGLAAVAGGQIDPLAEAMLADHGMTGKFHVARQVTPSLIEKADIVLAMERRHLTALNALDPGSEGRTFLLGKWQGGVDIPDPYRRPQSAFALAYAMIDAAIASWHPKLEQN